MRHHLAGKCRKSPCEISELNEGQLSGYDGVQKKDQRDEALVTCLPKDPAMYNMPLKSPDMLSPIQICLQSWNSFLAGTDSTGLWQPRWVPFFVSSHGWTQHEEAFIASVINLSSSQDVLSTGSTEAIGILCRIHHAVWRKDSRKHCLNKPQAPTFALKIGEIASI